MKKHSYFFISAFFMFTSAYSIDDYPNKYIDEYKNSKKNIISYKELCDYVIEKSSNPFAIEWDTITTDIPISRRCRIPDEGLSSKTDNERFNALNFYIREHADEIKKARQLQDDLEKKKENEKQKRKLEEFDKIKNEGRVYATLVMDTTENYNKDSLNTLKKNDLKIAGLYFSYDTNKANLIEKITLRLNTQELDKIKTYLNNIEEKYKKVDYKREVKELDLSLVRNKILKYHNDRKKHSQANYNIDYNNAHAIKNLEETYYFENKGDQIIVTIKSCLDGMQNSNAELLLTDIYENSFTIEYISKTLIEKEKAEKQEKEKKDNEINLQEKKELNKL